MTEAALQRLDLLETLEHAFEAWDELRAEHAAFLSRCVEERRKLDRQGTFLVGAVRAAAEQSGPAAPDSTTLATRSEDPLQKLLAEAETKIADARATLEKELASEVALYEEAFERIRTEIEQRVQRMLAGAPPRLRLLLRPLGQTRTLLHLDRVSGDESVLLLYAFAGRIPSRYGFLFDDSTDDATLPPQPLYAEEGVPASGTRPDPDQLRAYLQSGTRVLAIKGFLPVFVPTPDGGEAFYRLLQRGPVMEVELLRGGEFTSILEREEGERFAGHLLRLKLAGKIRLEMEAG
ncbi:MAG: hypothetical protein IRZ16_04785 [Myxococcaceae bacterium]|nr:hypothetical protein [Myxococcaceae bacterium]